MESYWRLVSWKRVGFKSPLSLSGSKTSFSCPSNKCYFWSFLVYGFPRWLLGVEAIERGWGFIVSRWRRGWDDSSPGCLFFLGLCFGFVLVVVCGMCSHRERVVQMMVLALHEELLLFMLCLWRDIRLLVRKLSMVSLHKLSFSWKNLVCSLMLRLLVVCLLDFWFSCVDLVSRDIHVFRRHLYFSLVYLTKLSMKTQLGKKKISFSFVNLS